MGQVNISFHRDEKTWSPISHTVNKRGVSDFVSIIFKIIFPFIIINFLERFLQHKNLNF